MGKKILGVCIILMLAVLCACTGKQELSAEAEQQPIPQFTPLTEISEGKKNIYLITKVLESNYWDVVVQGAKAAGNEFGCNVYYSGTYNEMDWENQLILLDKAVAGGADAIVFAPNDSIELADRIEEIYAMGIPIILVDTIVNTDSFDICYMTDNLEAGSKAAKEMLDSLRKMEISEDEEITVGILVGSGKSQTINERLAGFYQYWTENAPDKWNIISDIKNCNGDMEVGAKMVESLLDENSDIRGLFATNNGPTKVLAQTVSNRACKDVAVVGFDYSEEIKKLIDSEEYKASTILQRQYYMSYNGVKTALDLIDGSKSEIKFEDMGVIVVNNENIESPEVQALIEGK